jgi:hypothetical protein
MSTESFGDIQIWPRLEVREEYNDNIFLASKDRDEDFITIVAPSLSVGYEGRKTEISLNYGLRYRFYSENTQLNDTEFKNVQRATLDMKTNAYKDVFFVEIFDKYERVPIDERRQVTVDNELVNMTDSNYLRIKPYAEVPLLKNVSLNGAYQYENYWYDAEEGGNAEDQQATIGITSKIFERTTGSISYSYLWHRPEQNEKYDSQSVSGRVEQRFTRAVALDGGAEYTSFDFETSLADDEKTTWHVGMTYDISAFSTLNARYQETFDWSVNEGTFENRDIRGSLNYEKRRVSMAVEGFRSIKEFLNVEREDRGVGGTIEAGLPIGRRLTLGMEGGYTYFEYLPEDETADRFHARLSAAYERKYVTVGGGYTYNLNNASVDDDDYENNIVWIKLQISR